MRYGGLRVVTWSYAGRYAGRGRASRLINRLLGPFRVNPDQRSVIHELYGIYDKVLCTDPREPWP